MKSLSMDTQRELGITGKQRLRNIRTKVRLIGQRDMRKFLAGEIPWLPCTRDYEREFIEREFDRLAKARKEMGGES